MQLRQEVFCPKNEVCLPIIGKFKISGLLCIHDKNTINGKFKMRPWKLLISIVSRIAWIDDTLIPTGDIVKVEGTPYDFTRPKTIGIDIAEQNEQLKFGAVRTGS